MRLSINELNRMTAGSFVEKLGSVFENSPWVAERTYQKKPFQSQTHLYETMVEIVQNAGEALQLRLLRSHPDLGTKLKISAVSTREQSGAGLDQLSEEEYNQFAHLNTLYLNKFHFPFIMAVKGQSKQAILTAMKKRINKPYKVEYDTALWEVYKIACFRLDDIFL
ncbi:2-oxo-4-hydroxy-4-carboxy-5-ureidoimidazoline decarboxylase [Bacillus taeanensis]|uniref:2-oxo-4-hydroxy-4-carboxy-5-ureidoimidazoline decarboxylase n=1 Tax=Bacillus taeanensis TaxID=273032 RepID=A0A366XUH2_9BACI|nr:2-oxo-4-hydroxy-4-carboxy-5-ureidoimidazoline decarboxylase [Bacillus taeanensis]